MLTWEDDVEVHALRKRGWSISAIARHTGRDRKTVRAYLNGDRSPGVRVRAVDMVEADARDPGPRAAPGLRGMRGSHGATERSDRAPAWG